MPLTQADIRQALEKVPYPGYSRDIVSFGMLKSVEFAAGKLQIFLELPSSNPEVTAALQKTIASTLTPLAQAEGLSLELHLSSKDAPAPQKPPAPKRLPSVKKTLAIASGKGGVGKTTVAVNLAYALSLQGLRVGLLDCDVYGPTVPLMLGATGEPFIEDGKIVPLQVHGLSVMSMGLLIDKDQPVIWRGAMINKVVSQFIDDVAWGTLDVLLIDLPPGTGDAPLTLAQTLRLDGVLIITTPQMAAAQVATRGAQLFRKLEVPILGVIENMSYLPISDAPDSPRQYIFGQGGGAATSETLGVKLLAELPLDGALRENADAGLPILAAAPKSESARIYRELAAEIMEPHG